MVEGALLFQAASFRCDAEPQSWLLTGTTDPVVRLLNGNSAVLPRI